MDLLFLFSLWSELPLHGLGGGDRRRTEPVTSGSFSEPVVLDSVFCLLLCCWRRAASPVCCFVGSALLASSGCFGCGSRSFTSDRLLSLSSDRVEVGLKSLRLSPCSCLLCISPTSYDVVPNSAFPSFHRPVGHRVGASFSCGVRDRRGRPHYPSAVQHIHRHGCVAQIQPAGASAGS